MDGRYLVSYESGDDHFDWTEGYSGRNQFLIGFQSTRSIRRRAPACSSTDPQGFEGDGCNGTGCDLGFATQPFSVPVFANFTLIGPGTGTTSPAAGDSAWCCGAAPAGISPTASWRGGSGRGCRYGTRRPAP